MLTSVISAKRSMIALEQRYARIAIFNSTQEEWRSPQVSFRLYTDVQLYRWTVLEKILNSNRLTSEQRGKWTDTLEKIYY